MRSITSTDLGRICGIGRSAVHALVGTGRIPYNCVVSAVGDVWHFCPDAINRWMLGRPNLNADEDFLENLKKTWLAEHPETMEAIREFGKKFSEKKPPKLYYLIKVDNEKLGFKYYVKYLDWGKLVPSKWCTHTNDEKAAAAFAGENRERILGEYYSRKARPPAELYNILDRYYEKDSPFLIADRNRGRVLGEDKRRINDGFVKKRFVPFLKKNKVRYVEDMDTALLARFQDYLLRTVKPQTVNAYMAGVKMIFRHFVTTGYAKLNPCAGLPPIRVKREDVKATGCYELDRLKGVFDKTWKNRRYHLMCLLIYSTGMRNGEINRIRLGDIVEIDGCKFIDIPKSKSASGERRIPLHDFVYKKIVEYVPDNADFVFPQKPNTFDDLCARANLSLAEHTGHTAEMLKSENIVFYSAGISGKPS